MGFRNSWAAARITWSPCTKDVLDGPGAHPGQDSGHDNQHSENAELGDREPADDPADVVRDRLIDGDDDRDRRRRQAGDRERREQDHERGSRARARRRARSGNNLARCRELCGRVLLARDRAINPIPDGATGTRTPSRHCADHGVGAHQVSEHGARSRCVTTPTLPDVSTSTTARGLGAQQVPEPPMAPDADVNRIRRRDHDGTPG